MKPKAVSRWGSSFFIFLWKSLVGTDQAASVFMGKMKGNVRLFRENKPNGLLVIFLLVLSSFVLIVQ
jgi:hypothetical protein